MRIIGGKFGTRSIKSPPSHISRPTKDMVREAIFNMLVPAPKGARVLDLFAGSGALGLEALSRGAKYCCFVDSSSLACRIISDNLQRLNLSRDHYDIRRCKAASFLAEGSFREEFQLVFADPPYHEGLIQFLMGDLAGSEGIAGGALVVVEMSKDRAYDFPLEGGTVHKGQFTVLRNRIYGNTGVLILRKLGGD